MADLKPMPNIPAPSSSVNETKKSDAQRLYSQPHYSTDGVTLYPEIIEFNSADEVKRILAEAMNKTCGALTKKFIVNLRCFRKDECLPIPSKMPILFSEETTKFPTAEETFAKALEAERRRILNAIESNDLMLQTRGSYYISPQARQELVSAGYRLKEDSKDNYFICWGPEEDDPKSPYPAKEKVPSLEETRKRTVIGHMEAIKKQIELAKMKGEWSVVVHNLCPELQTEFKAAGYRVKSPSHTSESTIDWFPQPEQKPDPVQDTPTPPESTNNSATSTVDELD